MQRIYWTLLLTLLMTGKAFAAVQVSISQVGSNVERFLPERSIPLFVHRQVTKQIFSLELVSLPHRNPSDLGLLGYRVVFLPFVIQP